MTALEIVEQAIAALTPARLRTVIEGLAQTQAPDNREGVSVGPIMDAVVGDQALLSGPGAWDAYLRLQQAIKRMVAQVAGMRYIEADS